MKKGIQIIPNSILSRLKCCHKFIGLTKRSVTSLLVQYLITPVSKKKICLSAPGYITQLVVHHIASEVIEVFNFVIKVLKV